MDDVGKRDQEQTATELLAAAERALFDATARLQEALSVMDREGLSTPPATLARARQWSALIERGLERLGRRATVLARSTVDPLHS